MEGNQIEMRDALSEAAAPGDAAMNEKKETIEDILDRLLSKKSVDTLAAIDSAEMIRVLLGYVASQIKAAAKREKAAAEADAIYVGGLVEATRHKSGNAAAMREDDANLSSWDGVDAQIDALKRLARTRVGGHECAMPCAEFADTVERLDAARKRELASRDKTSFHCGDCAKFGFDCGAGDVDGNEDCIACDKFRRRAAPGNNAALREALMKAKLYFDHRGEGTNLDDAGMAIDAITSIYVAISAPQRNCDVGTPEEQARRFDAFCGAHHFQSEKCCSDCPCQGAECEFKWSQMPYDKIEERIRKEATHE